MSAGVKVQAATKPKAGAKAQAAVKPEAGAKAQAAVKPKAGVKAQAAAKPKADRAVSVAGFKSVNVKPETVMISAALGYGLLKSLKKPAVSLSGQKKKALTFVKTLSRGREIRTPVNGFGDRNTTTV